MRYLLVIIFLFIFNLPSYADQQKILYAINILGQDSLPVYNELNQYLNEKLKMELKPEFTNDRVAAIQQVVYKEAAMALLCTGPYVIGSQRYGLDVVAAIKPSAKATYRSYIIVPADSPAKTLRDLKNRSFVFVNLQAYTGRHVPLYMIKQMGEDPKTFFSSLTYSNSHEKSIYLVAEKQAEGAAVMSLVFDYIAKKNPELLKKVKVIQKSEPTGPPLFVTSKYADAHVVEKLRDALTKMHSDKKGKEILKKLHVESFYLPADEEYKISRQQIDFIKELIP